MQRNTLVLVDSIFKIYLDKWLAGGIAQYLFKYEIPWISYVNLCAILSLLSCDKLAYIFILIFSFGHKMNKLL